MNSQLYFITFVLFVAIRSVPFKLKLIELSRSLYYAKCRIFYVSHAKHFAVTSFVKIEYNV